MDLFFPNAVSDEHHYFGRPGVIDYIIDKFERRQRVPVIVLGERRVGKTSTQNVVLNRLYASSQPRIFPLIIEPREIRSFSDFARAFLLRLLHVERKSQPDLLIETSEKISNLKSIEEFEMVMLQYLPEGGDSLYLVSIDEFDTIFVQVQENERNTIIGLIYYLLEKTNYPVGFFFSMTSIPEEMKSEIPSPLVSMSHLVELYPLDEKGMEELIIGICKDNFQWERDALHQLFLLSGGHPYFVKLFLSEIISHFREWEIEKINADHIDKAHAYALVNPAGNVVENIYRAHLNNDEKELMLYLIQQKGSITASELITISRSWNSVALRLVKRKYLNVLNEVYSSRIAYFSEWLKEWPELDCELESFNRLQNAQKPSIELQVDENLQEVRCRGKVIKVSRQDFSILYILVKHPGQLISREKLIDEVWGSPQGVTDQSVDAAFYRLRKKIGDAGEYIETHSGKGFVLHNAVFIPKKG